MSREVRGLVVVKRRHEEDAAEALRVFSSKRGKMSDGCESEYDEGGDDSSGGETAPFLLRRVHTSSRKQLDKEQHTKLLSQLRKTDPDAISQRGIKTPVRTTQRKRLQRQARQERQTRRFALVESKRDTSEAVIELETEGARQLRDTTAAMASLENMVITCNGQPMGVRKTKQSGRSARHRHNAAKDDDDDDDDDDEGAQPTKRASKGSNADAGSTGTGTRVARGQDGRGHADGASVGDSDSGEFVYDYYYNEDFAQVANQGKMDRLEFEEGVLLEYANESDDDDAALFDDDDDSNDESNWRNDYPDEEDIFAELEDEVDSDIGADSDADMYDYGGMLGFKGQFSARPDQGPGHRGMVIIDDDEED